MKKIESRNNPIFKNALKSSRGQYDNDRFLVVEGYKLIKEAIKSDIELEMCFIDNEDVLKNLLDLIEKCYLVSTAMLKELSTVTSPGNIVAYFACKATISADILLSEAKSIVVLDRIQDPGNLGTILRTSEAMGINTILLIKGSCNPANPKVIRSAMGSSFRIHVATVSDHFTAIKLLKKYGFHSIALHMEGENITNYIFPEKCAFIFGQEGQGLSPQILKECTAKLAIPMQGQVESLNVAVSAAICLYQWSQTAIEKFSG